MAELVTKVTVLLYADEVITISSVKAVSLNEPESPESLITKKGDRKTQECVPSSISFDANEIEFPCSPMNYETRQFETKGESEDEDEDEEESNSLDEIGETNKNIDADFSDDDDSSGSSLVSDRDSDSSSSIISDETESSIEDESTKLRRKWKMRDREIKVLTKGRSARYTRYLKENEEEARKVAHMRLDMKKHLSNFDHGAGWKKCSNSLESIEMSKTSCTSTETKSSPCQKPTNQTLTFASVYSHLRRLFYFDLYYTIPSFITVILYCVAHLSLSELVGCLISEATKSVTDLNTVYFSVLLMGLVLMRTSGHLWQWVHDDEYPLVKFDMHNRKTLNEPDAKILLWLRRHKLFRVILNIASLYLCFNSVSYFLSSVILPSLFDIRTSILDGLPSQKLEVTTVIKSLLDGAATPKSLSPLVTGLKGEECLDADMIYAEDDYYFWSRSSSLYYYMIMGSQADATGIVSTLGLVTFYSITSGLSILLLMKTGFEFWNM